MNKSPFDFDQLEYLNKVLDFGPPLRYHVLCTAYTLQKISIWTTHIEDRLEALAFQNNRMPTARAEGILYRLTDEEVYSLDKQRRVGLDCERKFLKVIIPYRPPVDKSQGFDAQLNPPPYHTCMANVYVARNAAWNPRIENDLTTLGNSQVEKINFRLAGRFADPDPILNNRFAVIPPPAVNHPVDTAPPSVIKRVRRANRAEMRRLWLRNFFRDDQ